MSYFTEDSLDFLIKNSDKDQAMKHIKKIYSNYDNTVHEEVYSQKHNQHEEFQAQQSAKGEDNIWLALTDKQMRKSSWISIFIALCN